MPSVSSATGMFHCFFIILYTLMLTRAREEGGREERDEEEEKEEEREKEEGEEK